MAVYSTGQDLVLTFKKRASYI